VGLQLTVLNQHSSVNSWCVATYTTTKNHYIEYITGHKNPNNLDNIKIGDLKVKNRDHEKYLNKMNMSNS